MAFLVAISNAIAVAYATSFSSKVGVGSVIIGVLVGILTIVAAGFGVKYKTVAAVEARGREAAQNLAEIKDAESKDLHMKLLDALKIVGDQKAVIERLEALPNLSIIIDQMSKETERAEIRAKERQQIALQSIKETNEQLWAQHEEHANRRTGEIINTIRAIAEQVSVNTGRINELKEDQ